MIVDKLINWRSGSIENPSVPLSEVDWDEMFGTSHDSDAGQNVTVKTALSLSPVWMAVKMISGDCSKLPLRPLKRRKPGPGKDEDPDHQAWQFIHRDGLANDETPALELWRNYFAAYCLWENGYIWIDRDNAGRIRGLYNLLPDRTGMTRVNGRLWYVTEFEDDQGKRKLQPLPHHDVLHLRGLCWNGCKAPELVRQARHDFGVALAARKFTSKFFANGAHHGGVLQLPPGYTKDGKDKIEKALHDQRNDPAKWFKHFVLRDGYRFYNTTVEPEKAQTVELDENQVRHVARWFMLNPSRLGVKDSTSYNSEEAAKQDYHDTTLSYPLTANEAQCNAKLLTTREISNRSHVIRYQINALLWADAAQRAEIAARGIETGRFSPDETRDWEGLNPRDDGEGDLFMRPLNMTAVGGDDGDDQATRGKALSARSSRLSQGESEAAKAHRGLIAGSVRRILARLHTHAQRAAKRGELSEWLDLTHGGKSIAEHRGVCQSMLAAEVDCIRATFGVDRSAEIVTDAVFGKVCEALRSCNGDDLPAQVDQSFAGLEQSLPAAIAAETISAEM